MSPLLMLSVGLAQPLQQAEDPLWNTSLVFQGVRPGFKLGAEFELAERVKKRPNRRRPPRRRIIRELAIEPSFTAWHHWGNHTPLTLSGQLITRRVKQNGRYREWFVGQGATYAINAGRTYSFDGDGELQGNRMAGRLMSATSVGFGVGREIPRTALAWHVRPTVTFWAPYLDGAAPVITLEFGVRQAWPFGGAR